MECREVRSNNFSVLHEMNSDHNKNVLNVKDSFSLRNIFVM